MEFVESAQVMIGPNELVKEVTTSEVITSEVVTSGLTLGEQPVNQKIIITIIKDKKFFICFYLFTFLK